MKVAVGIITTTTSYYLSANDRYIEILAILPEILERTIFLSIIIYGQPEVLYTF